MSGIDPNNLEDGVIYEIQFLDIPTSPARGPYQTLQARGIRYVRILNKVGNSTYEIMPLDLDYNDKPIIGRFFGQQYPTGTRTIDMSRPRVTIIKKIGLSPSQKIALGEAELQKQRAESTRSALFQKTQIPATKATGPLGNILDFAGIKSPKSKFGGKTRKGKKSKKIRKTHKH